MRVIGTVRNIGAKRIITIFGCGGDRDISKREIMGEIVSKLSDFSIITSDNPRSEDPRSIINDILVAYDGKIAGDEYQVFFDREDAIKQGIAMLRAGDALIIAGKGHEDYQIIKGKKQHFSDMEVALKCLTDSGITVDKECV